MRLTWEPLTLELITPFRIAHGTSERRHNVLVRLEAGENTGLGEAAAVPYYGETREGITASLAACAGVLGDDPDDIDGILDRLPAGSQSARAAIDIALHDLLGKRLGRPLYRVLGLDPARCPETSFTVAMDAPEAMAQRARESGAPIIKVKLGAGDDEAIVSAIRGATDARLTADANAGWTLERAARLIPRLARYGIEFIEQPLAVGDVEGLRRLRAMALGAPIFADENVRTSDDVAAHDGAVDGIVVKLAKTGGIREALRTIAAARERGMKVMMGCTIETAVAITAAAHLAPLCDYADLDAPLLTANDPFIGLRYDGARLILPDGPGLGVSTWGACPGPVRR